MWIQNVLAWHTAGDGYSDKIDESYVWVKIGIWLMKFKLLKASNRYDLNEGKICSVG